MKSGLLKSIGAIAVLALVSMACGAAVPTIAVPTVDIQSIATQIVPVDNGGDSQPPADNGGGQLLSDNFESRSSNWGVGTDTDYEVQYVDGALQIKVVPANMKVYSGPNGTSYKNIHIEADAINQGSDPKAAFGVLCNQQVISDEFYFGYVTPSGEYGIVKSVFINDDVELTSGTTDLISKDASTYRVGMDCAANGTMTLYVNGQQVATASDTEYAGGTVGVIAWSGDVESGTTVSFDNYVITQLP
ncbi:MAG: hypothetical protein HYZ25_03715 [Chloroflexi bacterium]|nr:hypothetical protein [Chloroflexota bacterium]